MKYSKLKKIKMGDYVMFNPLEEDKISLNDNRIYRVEFINKDRMTLRHLTDNDTSNQLMEDTNTCFINLGNNPLEGEIIK